MKDEIDIGQIRELREKYCATKDNILIEKEIQQNGLLKVARNDAKYRFRFNIEVPKVKIYNQHDSYQCNIYAFLRVLKDILRQNTELNVGNLNLSANYINFYDKLEKANVLYNDLIADNHLTLEMIRDKVNWYIGSFGTFHFCREIVNKYGLVLTKDARVAEQKYDDKLVTELFRNKIKADAVSLLDLNTKTERAELKNTLMYETYQFLAKVYGQPPASFELRDQQFTPLEFKEKFLTNSLEDYVTVTPLDKNMLLESYAFIPNIYLNNTETILHSTPKKIQDAIVKQLISGVSVWFSAEERTAADYPEGVLDNKLYDFGKLLNVPELSAAQKLALGITGYNHAMCITGALTKDGQVQQLKVDNSFGAKGKYGGQMIMTKAFLESNVITLIINKKFLV